jgi:hypothetical protein
VGHAAHLGYGYVHIFYKILVGDPERRRHTRKLYEVWENNIKAELKEIRYEYMNSNHLIRNRNYTRIFMNTKIEIEDPQRRKFV